MKSARPPVRRVPEPVAGPGEVVVEVSAAGLNHLDLIKASGAFYTGPPQVPSVPGSDGGGRLADGRRVFSDALVAPYGSWAEKVLVSEHSLMDVAAGVDDDVAASLGNSVLAGVGCYEGSGAWLPARAAGPLAGVGCTQPAPVVRSAALKVLGMAVFQAPMDVRRAAYLELTDHVGAGRPSADFEQIASIMSLLPGIGKSSAQASNSCSCPRAPAHRARWAHADS